MSQVPRSLSFERVGKHPEPRFVDELAAASLQDHIVRWTPGDSARRFTDAKAFSKWYEQGRALYVMRKDQQLGGVAWFSLTENCDQDSPDIKAKYPTFALRIFQACQGQKLALPFAKFAHESYIDTFCPQAIWLDVKEDNEPARRVYEHIGYRAVEMVNKAEGTVTMIYRVKR